MHTFPHHRTDEARERGFTLIELLVVVLIIGILVGIAIPIFLNQRQKAAAATVQADVHNAVVATEAYDISNASVGVAFTVTGSASAGGSTTLPDGTPVRSSVGNSLQSWVNSDVTQVATKPLGYCIKGNSSRTTAVYYVESTTGVIYNAKPAASATTVCGSAVGVS